MKGSLKAVKYLVEIGAEVNAMDKVKLDMRNITRVCTCCYFSLKCKRLIRLKIARLNCMLTNNNHVNFIVINTIVQTAVIR